MNQNGNLPAGAVPAEGLMVLPFFLNPNIRKYTIGSSIKIARIR